MRHGIALAFLAIALGCQNESNLNSTASDDKPSEVIDNDGAKKPKSRKFRFVYGVTLNEMEPGADARVWIPVATSNHCLLYTSPSPRDATLSRMPSSA